VHKIKTASQVSFKCEALCLNITTADSLKVHELFNSHSDLEFVLAKEQDKLFNT
jgi:hypothetical protein